MSTTRAWNRTPRQKGTQLNAGLGVLLAVAGGKEQLPHLNHEGPSRVGLLFAVEGIDGSGKSTIVRSVGKRLVREGYRVRLTAEPSDLETGRVVRARLTRRLADALVDAEIDADYFLADRVYHNYTLIRPWLREGVHVVSDRYDLGTIAYQSCQGLPIDYLLDRRSWLLRLGLIEKPAIHFILDLTPETALARMDSRKLRTKFENRSFLTRLRSVYQSLPQLVDDRIAVVDAEQSEREVAAIIYGEIEGMVARDANSGQGV